MNVVKARFQPRKRGPINGLCDQCTGEQRETRDPGSVLTYHVFPYGSFDLCKPCADELSSADYYGD